MPPQPFDGFLSIEKQIPEILATNFCPAAVMVTHHGAPGVLVEEGVWHPHRRYVGGARRAHALRRCEGDCSKKGQMCMVAGSHPLVWQRARPHEAHHTASGGRQRRHLPSAVNRAPSPPLTGVQVGQHIPSSALCSNGLHIAVLAGHLRAGSAVGGVVTRVGGVGAEGPRRAGGAGRRDPDATIDIEK